ncbi:MAG: PEGA domain-containing protein, partial [Pyrinomonadaceae bacterium]
RYTMKFLSLLMVIAVFATTIPFTLAQTSPSAVAEAPVQMPSAPLAFGLVDGTPVKLRIGRNMSSADAKTGETIDFEVLEDIKIGEIIVIPRGGTALGTVTRGKPKGRMGKGGKLDINIDSVRTVTGEKIALRAIKESKGKGSTGAMTGAIVASSILFFPAAPFFLFMKGKDIKIPKGTEITAYVSGDASLDRGKFMTGENRITGAETQQALNTSASTTVIKSDPEGADISINGRFMGSTPSSLLLQPGEHKVILKKAGFSDWERTITSTAGGNVTLNASMEKVREK